MSRHASISPAAHSAPWIVARLFATRGAGATLTAELHHALDAEGVHDRECYFRALLGVTSFASRAGCAPAQVRHVVACIVHGVAASVLDAPRVQTLVGHSLAFVDAVYLLNGTTDVPPTAVTAALDVVDTLDVLDALAVLESRIPPVA